MLPHSSFLSHSKYWRSKDNVQQFVSFLKLFESFFLSFLFVYLRDLSFSFYLFKEIPSRSTMEIRRVNEKRNERKGNAFPLNKNSYFVTREQPKNWNVFCLEKETIYVPHRGIDFVLLKLGSVSIPRILPFLKFL